MSLRSLLFEPTNEVVVMENAGPVFGFVETRPNGSVVLNLDKIELLKQANEGCLKGYEVQVMEPGKSYLVNVIKK